MKQLHTIQWSAKPLQTYVLNLDEGFNPFSKWENTFVVNYKTMNFHGGERHLQILSDLQPGGDLVISHRINSMVDLFDIILANDAARRMGIFNISLVIPYFPAARQDRVCNVGEPLTVKVVADLINGCGFKEVAIFSPHSEVAPALLNNCSILALENEYAQWIFEDNKKHIQKDGRVFNVVCPDAGAAKRVEKIAKHLANNNGHFNIQMIRCEKVRDVATGQLKEFIVQTDDLKGAPCVIFDDINSMGGTFLGLGEKLREKGCGNLSLFTAHSDCQKGIENVLTKFDNVYTTNSKRDYAKLVDDKKLKVFDIAL